MKCHLGVKQTWKYEYFFFASFFYSLSFPPAIHSIVLRNIIRYSNSSTNTNNSNNEGIKIFFLSDTWASMYALKRLRRVCHDATKYNNEVDKNVRGNKIKKKKKKKKKENTVCTRVMWGGRGKNNIERSKNQRKWALAAFVIRLQIFLIEWKM